MVTTLNTEDLVARLRERSGQYDEYGWHSAIELEAADEIESLRKELRTYDDWIQCLLTMDDWQLPRDKQREIVKREFWSKE